mgnify:CR=1 FL=1
MPKQKPGRSKQDYATPVEFMDAAKNYLGISAFEADFAADVQNAKGLLYWDIEIDSLSMNRGSWRAIVANGWGWLNPPFAHITPWAKRCKELKEDGGKIALLVPAAVGSNWFRDYVFRVANVIALNGRLSFDGIAPYPKDCMLCLYGDEPGFDVWNWRNA